jgi:hypothetical protein
VLYFEMLHRMPSVLVCILGMIGYTVTEHLL